MGKHSFYGNVINPPKFLQHIQGENNTNFTVDSLGDTFKISGDNYISTLISNDQLIINHINKNKSLQQPFNHNQINNPQDNNNLYGTILSLPIITAINIDQLGHTTHLAMQDYNFSLIGKKYNGSGEIFNDYSTNVASGQYSHSEGKNTQALGNSSHSEGNLTIAQGNYSHSEGYQTQSLSTCSHAEGSGTQAQTAYTHAEGYYSIASDDPADPQGGVGSHAEGYKTKALGRASHSEGALSEASGRYSHAEGQETKAQGYYSHAEGFCSQAIGTGTYAGGCESKAYGPYSYSFGLNTISRNPYSFALGKFNVDDNNAIFQIGWGDAETSRKDLFKITLDGYVKIPTYELQAREVVATKNNVKLSEMPITIHDEDTYFTIQQGTSDPITIQKPYNAMVNNAEIVGGSVLVLHVNGPNSTDIPLEVDLSEILIDAQVTSSDTITLETIKSGELAGYIQGSIKNNSISTNLIQQDAITNKKIANLAVTDEKISSGINGEKISDNSIEESKIKGTIHGSKIEQLSITNNHLEGKITSDKIAPKFYTDYIDIKLDKNNSIGNGSISYNRKKDTDIGNNSCTFGLNNIASMDRAFAEGYETQAINYNAHAEGNQTIASGAHSHAEGEQTVASGARAHAEGYLTVASGDRAHAEGTNTEANGSFSHAEGTRSQAIGTQSHAQNYETIARGLHSHAEGQNTIINGRAAHVQGKFNLPDTFNDQGYSEYAHIVGNGESDTQRSNAHTLDWNGNAWYAGSIETNDKIILRSNSIKEDGTRSDKKFAISIDDNAVLLIEEV